MVNKLSLLIFSLFLSFSVLAEDNTTTQPETNLENSAFSKTFEALTSFIKQKDKLQLEIKTLKNQIDSTKSIEEKNELKIQLLKTKQELATTRGHLREIAAGIDLSLLNVQEEEVFDFQKELFSLIKPAFDEMKEMTAHVRQKSDLKEGIAYYNERLSVINQAIENIDQLKKKSDNQSIKTSLNFTSSNLVKQRTIMQSELQALQLRFDHLLAEEKSISEASQSWVKSFFQKRGLYLTEALVLIFFIILLSKLSYTAMQLYLPGFRVQHRSFRIRLIELIHRFLTLFFTILGPMAIFYIVEDWVLFSLGILLLIGFSWTLRQALPYYWKQIYLFLNIGSVREGERLFLDGLPWKVQKINMYCTFINPVAALTIRVPIQELVELKSRPSNQDEPWFPCKKNDWVMLNDGVRGKVIGISQEMVQLVERGNAIKTYQMNDFLSCSPRNLSVNFRIKETLGISYLLQEDSTTRIPEILRQFIQHRAEQGGYAEQLLSLKVEFELANSSSLDLVVIADFKGEAAEIYNRLRRAIQRWGVEACTENKWEIPFPQMSLHHSSILIDSTGSDS